MDDRLTVPQAARRLGVTGMTLYRWIGRGAFPAPEVGLRRSRVRGNRLVPCKLVRPADVEAFLRGSRA